MWRASYRPASILGQGHLSHPILSPHIKFSLSQIFWKPSLRSGGHKIHIIFGNTPDLWIEFSTNHFCIFNYLTLHIDFSHVLVHYHLEEPLYFIAYWGLGNDQSVIIIEIWKMGGIHRLDALIVVRRFVVICAHMYKWASHSHLSFLCSLSHFTAYLRALLSDCLTLRKSCLSSSSQSSCISGLPQWAWVSQSARTFTTRRDWSSCWLLYLQLPHLLEWSRVCWYQEPVRCSI